MFNLDQAILEWRRQMLAADIKSPVPLDELETHLRDEIEQQAKSGLSGAEAFKIAVQKIGQAHRVQNEFKKVEPTKADWHWKLVQILLLAFSSLFPLGVGSQVFYFKTGSASQMTPGQKISCLAALMTFSLLAWGGRLSYRLFPVILAKRIRDAIHYSCFVLVALWWIVFLTIIVPRYDFTACQFVVTFLWAFIVPGGASIGLICGIETAARKKVAMIGV
jgi:hypothetical protein